MLTAEQVSGMIGPETPDCDCPGCVALAKVKHAICKPITALDSVDAPAWMAALMIVASRLAVQGIEPTAIMDAMSHGYNQGKDQNPVLCSGPVLQSTVTH